MGAMFSWCFDRGLEVVWSSWPLQIYVRFRTMWGKAVQEPLYHRKFRTPVFVAFRNMVRAREELKNYYWETDGFGFDVVGRKQYLTSEAVKLGLTVTETK